MPGTASVPARRYVAISVFGLKSPAALATIVGVLTEVPVMLTLVRISNRTKHWFPEAKSASVAAL
jgi:ACR3 family arsenite transporter